MPATFAQNNITVGNIAALEACTEKLEQAPLPVHGMPRHERDEFATWIFVADMEDGSHTCRTIGTTRMGTLTARSRSQEATPARSGQLRYLPTLAIGRARPAHLGGVKRGAHRSTARVGGRQGTGLLADGGRTRLITKRCACAPLRRLPIFHPPPRLSRSLSRGMQACCVQYMRLCVPFDMTCVARCLDARGLCASAVSAVV